MRPEIETLKSIVDYCRAISDDVSFFGNDVETYLENSRYQRSVTFSLFQIGEKTKNLRKNFGSRYDTDYWKKIAGLRDVIGHGYDAIDHNITWKIVVIDVPELERVCERIISELERDSGNHISTFD